MKSFSILGGKAHVVELPEGAKFPRIETNQSIIPYGQDLCWDRNGGEKSYGMDETEWVGLHPGTWQIVGRLSEVTADDVADLTGHYYNKYNERYVEFACSATRVTPIDDLESVIVAAGYTFKSEPKPENKDFYWGYLDDLAKWEAAQQRVLSRERTLILRRIDG